MGWIKQTMIILMLSMATSAQAQTFSEWFRQKKTQIAYYAEQIAALKAYNDLLVKGYGIVRDGLQVAHDIRQGEFDLHHDYFESLLSVNGSFKTDLAETLYHDVIRQCDAVQSLADRFPKVQQQYVLAVTNTLKRKASERYNEYVRLTTAEQYQLTDDQRMRRIDESIKALHDQYGFLKRFYYGLQKMIMQEIREDNDVKGIQNIYLH